MNIGDLIMFRKSGEYAIYLGLIDEMYTFQHWKYGMIELWKENFDINNVEVVKGNKNE